MAATCPHNFSLDQRGATKVGPQQVPILLALLGPRSFPPCMGNHNLFGACFRNSALGYQPTCGVRVDPKADVINLILVPLPGDPPHKE